MAVDIKALDAPTGNLVWTQTLSAQSFAPITVANGVGFVPSQNTLNAFDVATGKMLFSTMVAGSTPSGAVVVDGIVSKSYGRELPVYAVGVDAIERCARPLDLLHSPVGGTVKSPLCAKCDFSTDAPNEVLSRGHDVSRHARGMALFGCAHRLQQLRTSAPLMLLDAPRIARLHHDAYAAILDRMRTTIDLEPALIERAKRLALKDGRTLSAVVNCALAAYLSGRKGAGKEEPFELIVRGKAGGRFPTPADLAAVEESEDLEPLRIPRGRERAAP